MMDAPSARITLHHRKSPLETPIRFALGRWSRPSHLVILHCKASLDKSRSSVSNRNGVFPQCAAAAESQLREGAALCSSDGNLCVCSTSYPLKTGIGESRRE